MLRANKVRSFLTMLGIIIGVMGVSVTIELVEGFRSFMNSQFAKIGSNTLFVVFDPSTRRRGETFGTTEGLRVEDVDNIRRECSLVKLVTPETEMGGLTATRQELQIKNVVIAGVEPAYFVIRGLDADRGRFFDDTDVAEWSANAVIGSEVASKLFPLGDALGKEITVAGRTMSVIGVVKKQGSSLGNNEDSRVYLPVTTVLKRWTGSKRIAAVIAQPVSEKDTEGAMDQIWQCLMRHHNNKAVFRIGSQEALTAAFGAIVTGLGLVFSGVAALALLVGGIGIMNIMLVSVTERTREIGLRMAVGAKRFEVLLQFLVESATLSLVGGLMGMALGYGLGGLVDWFTHSEYAKGMPGITMTFPLWAAAGAALFSASIGVVFGIYPAWRAARMDPIEALRHE